MATPTMFSYACLLVSILKQSLLLPLTVVHQAALSLVSLLTVLFLLIYSEDSMENASMEESAETHKFRVSVVVNGAMADALGRFVSPWPAMGAPVDATSSVSYEQYKPPKELLLLLDEAQTPPEIRNIAFNALNRPADIVSRSEEPHATKETFKKPKAVDVPKSSESSQSTLEGSPSDCSHSPSESTASLSSSIGPTMKGSDEGARAKKATFSSLLSSTTNLVGSMKHAIKDSSSTEKKTNSERLQQVTRS